jgi:hypothetical protein
MNELKETIYKLETDLLKPEVRMSIEKLGEILADDFVEYGSSGLVYDKAMILQRLPQGPSPAYTIYDFEIIVLSETIVQSRFKSDRTNMDNTKSLSLRTSIWRKEGDAWRMVFHQGTITK